VDGQTKSITGSVVVSRSFDYGVNAEGTRYTQEFVGPTGVSSPLWTKTTVDWISRIIALEKPSFTGVNVIQTSTYNDKGQIQAETTTSGATKLISDWLHEYDDLGNQIRSGMDIDGNGSLTTASTDRLTEMDVSYQKVNTDWFRLTTTKTYLTYNSATPTVEVQKVRRTIFRSMELIKLFRS